MVKKQRFEEHLPNGSQLSGYNYLHYPLHKFHVFGSFDTVYPLYPNGVGDDYWHKECFRQRKNCNTFAVEYVKEGVFIFTHNGMEVECQPGEIFLIQMGSDNSMRCKTLTAVKRVANIGGPLLQTLLSTTGLDRVFCIRPEDNREIDRIFDELYKESERTPYDSGKLSASCYKLLLTLAEQSINTSRPEELQKAIYFIRQSLDKPITLTDIAHHAGVSKATLNRLFQEHLDCSPINFFLDLKMDKARSLLPYYQVKQVAAMLNFSSSQYFSAEFRKHYGVSPKAFRCLKP